MLKTAIVLTSLFASAFASTGCIDAPSSAADAVLVAPGDVQPRSCQTCPTAPTCAADVPFCAALATMLEETPILFAEQLNDACAAEQPHCDLCSHVRTSCLQSGKGIKECVGMEEMCNCAALADGQPSGCAGDIGAPCRETSECDDGLVCVDYQGGMCLQRCDPYDGNANDCGPNSWCTISMGPEPGMKCTPPIVP